MFRTLITQKKINLNFKDLEKYILSLQEKNTSKRFSNSTGWRSSDLDIKKNKNLQKIEEGFLEMATDYCRIIKMKKGLKSLSMWATVNKYKDYNLTHCHQGFLSGTFYVKTPMKCGDIVFENPSKLSDYWMLNGGDLFSSFNEYNSSSWTLPARKSIMYLFPSWLPHRVEPNLTKQNRISVSFNMGVENNVL